MSSERFAVFGAGAVGGYLGGKLWLYGSRNLTLIGRSPVVAAVREHGLVIYEGERMEVSHPAAVESPQALDAVDFVLLTVRTYDVDDTIDDVRRLIGATGLVLAFQNGVGTERTLGDALGRERVLPCTLTVSAGMEAAGEVTRYSRRGGMAVSTLTGAPVPGSLQTALRGTGLATIEVPDYRSLRWSKLLLNMLGAATTAILDIDLPLVVEHPDLFRLEQLALREASRVMDALDVDTVRLPGYPVPLVTAVMRLPHSMAQAVLGPRLAAARGGRSPGMRADLARGRSEIESYNGAVVRAATELGLPAPVNDALTAILLELVRDPDQRDHYRRQPRRLLTALESRGVKV